MEARAHRVSGVLQRWERFWFDPIPSHIYALLRIVFGVVGCAALIGVSDLGTFWNPAGLVPLEPWGPVKTLLRQQGLGEAAGGLLFFAAFAIFAAMTAGYKSAAAVPLAFAMSLAQSSWNYFPLSGAHTVLVSMLFCLMWADTGAVWSVDAWLARRRGEPWPADPRSAGAALRLVRFQVAVIYLNTGLWKLFSPVWRDGSAVYYVLNQNLFQRFAAERLPPSLDWLATAATYTTLLWEIAFAVLVLFRPTRILALALGVAVHVGLLFSIDVGLFSIVMLASYVAYLDPARVALWGRPRPAREPAAHM